MPLTTAPECEKDIEGRFTIRLSADSHRPSRLSVRARTCCGTAAGCAVAHRRHLPWPERPPSPRAWYGFGTRWKFTPRPYPPGVAPAPTIPGGKAVRTPLRDAADQPGPPPAAAVAETARAALLPAAARVVAGSGHPRRPWSRHRDPRLPLRSGPRRGFAAGPWIPPPLLQRHRIPCLPTVPNSVPATLLTAWGGFPLAANRGFPVKITGFFLWEHRKRVG